MHILMGVQRIAVSVRAVAPQNLMLIDIRQEKLRARALHDENERGGPMLPPGSGVL